MYIQKQEFRPGFNDYLRSDAGVGREINMDVQLLILERDDTIRIEEPEKEMAILLFEGTADAALDGQTRRISRQDTFRDGAWCIHICAGTPVVLQAREHCELYIQKTANERTFPSRIYGPDDVQTVEAGNNGELDGTMRRYIRTFFDYSNAPYSNMVLGEVQNFPGRWSSYPPHHHPQPEVYFYRFDKPQGFGAGFANIQDRAQWAAGDPVAVPFSGLRARLSNDLCVGDTPSARRSVGQDPDRRRGAYMAARLHGRHVPEIK